MELQSSKISVETIGRAVDALLKYNKSKSKSQKAQLFDEDDYFLLNLTLKKIPQKGRVNPFKIPLPHPFHPFDSSEEYCLIIDDRPKSSLTSASAKKKIQSENIPISKVLKLSKLKSDYRPFEAKRKLMNSYHMFFADKRIIPLLPRLLGKEFFKKKKIPIPVDLTHKGWKEQLQIGCESALMYLRSGTCSVVKVGRVSQGRDEIIENVVAAVNGMVEIIPKKWGNVRSFHLKLTESLALPVYQTVPVVGLKIEGVKKKDVVEEERKATESGEEEVGEESVKKQGKKKAKEGRIHEVQYMDQLLGGDMASDHEDADVGNMNDALGSGELIGTKRKKTDKKEKKRIMEDVDGTLAKEEVGEESAKKQGKKKAKKGIIHEVRCMDQLLGGDMASDDEDGDVGNMNDALGSGELVGTKRKKTDKKEKRIVDGTLGSAELIGTRSKKANMKGNMKIVEELSGKKEEKGSLKFKKGDGAKKKKEGGDGEQELKMLTKTKKGDGAKKKKEGGDGEQELKMSMKTKMGDGAKKKKKDDFVSEGEGGEKEIDGDVFPSASSEVKKKKSKAGKVGSAEIKIKKKSKRAD